MANRNISQFNLLTDVSTGDYILVYDTSTDTTVKTFINDIQNVTGSEENWFENIYVRRFAYISGARFGDTGSHIHNSRFGSILGGSRQALSGSGNAIVAGTRNTITSSASNSTICGGQINQITARDAAILGGDSNLISQFFSNVLGGNNNYVGSQFSVICNG